MSAVQADALPRHKLSTEDFHRMADAGIFHEDDRIELIEGELIDMAPIGSRHAECVSRLTRILIRQTDHVVRVQDPILLSGASEPQPDIVVAKPQSYLREHPGPADLFLLIEVADTTASYDRRVKLPLYARHGIAEVWIVDLTAGALERYTDPRGERYEACEYFDRQQVVSPALLSEIKVALMDLF